MSVTASTLIPSGSAAQASDLWQPPVAVRHNWRSPVTERISWDTTTLLTRGGREQRRQQVSRPYRIVEGLCSALSEASSHQILSAMSRRTEARFLARLHPDEVRLSGKAHPLFSTYLGDFEGRRFQPGAWVEACAGSEDSVSENPLHRKVVSVTDSSITLDGSLGESYSAPTLLGLVSSLQASVGSSVAGPSFVLERGESILGILGLIATGTRTVVSVSLRSLSSGLVVDITSMARASASKTFSGLGLFLSAVAGLPPQNDARIFGSVRIEWVLSSGSNSVVQAYSCRVSGSHKIVNVLSTATQPNAGPTPASSITVSPTMANSRIVSAHSAFSASGQFVLGNQTLLSQQSPAGLQTYVQSAVPASTGAMLFSASHNSLPDSDSLMAVAIEIAPDETGGFSRELLCPTLECDSSPGNEASVPTSRISELSVSASETPGVSALLPLASPGTSPAWAYLYSGLPILSLDPSWGSISVGSRRNGVRTRVGITSVVEAYGDRFLRSASLSFVLTDRESVLRLIEFFDCRAGRTLPFWLPLPAPSLTAIASGPSSVTFESSVSPAEWETVTHLAVRTAVGAWSIHEISSTVEGAGSRTVTVSPALPAGEGKEYLIAVRARFDSDELRVVWSSPNAGTSTIEIEELTSEGGDSAGVEPPANSVSDCAKWQPNNLFDLCRCRNRLCGSTDPDECCVCGLDPLEVQTYCYGPTDAGEGACSPHCNQIKACSGVLPFESCIAGVIRWSSGDVWVEMDTSTSVWSFDLGTLVTVWGCCVGTEEDFGFCSISPNCADLPADRETHTCGGYLREWLCDRFASDANCTHVPTVRFTVRDSGPGGARCAGL